ncbi:hypothetical protein TNCV_2057011 [Trichonephila clavipes]|nr:hypothetical protein TNCV_2057011 [Trichonephila clavipes]
MTEIPQNLPSESSDALTYDSSDEEVPANNLLEFSSVFEEDDQETEQDSVLEARNWFLKQNGPSIGPSHSQ